MQLIIAAGGGERDYAVDGQILTRIRRRGDPGVFLNERLMSDLRPTLFLAQLSNLLAGNISIVHGITGATRTFMGEEQSGVDALRIAHARIASGQTDIVLVGGSYNAERPDVLMVCAMGGYLWSGPFVPVFTRPRRAAASSSAAGRRSRAGAREPAPARGVTPLAASLAWRPGGRGGSRATWAFARAAVARGRGWPNAAVVSGATGVPGSRTRSATPRGARARRALCDGGRRRAYDGRAGAVQRGPRGGADRGRRGREAVATSVGHRRGEGVLRLRRL